MSTASYTPETFPHRWLPADVSFKTWEQIEPYYQQLLDRPIGSSDELEEWLKDVGELNSAVSQEGSQRYIAMTCQTDDPDREAAHLAFVRDIEPKLKPYLNQLRNRYLDSPHRSGLPTERYHVFDRAQENRRRLYREANIPRETELAELGQTYQKTIGSMTVTFRGEEKTLAQMAPYLEETDRALRQEVWEMVSRRRLEDRETLDSLFDRMITLREEIAREAEFPDYVSYAYANRERFDYGPEQAEAFQKAIESEVVPLARALQEKRRTTMALESLRPWDLAVDPRGRAPLRPFQDADRLAEGAAQIFSKVDEELGAQFSFMHRQSLLDLANRKGKAPGGYQANLEDDRLPFIFMNAVGVDGDLRTVLHEGGHAFHTLAARCEPLAEYRDAPIEFCEVASMSMELLGAPELTVFYSEDDAKRSYRELLEGIVLILPWIATVDAFQHWIYRHPGHSQGDRRVAWNHLMDRFGGQIDWSGYEEIRSNSWHRQLHIFLYPFYYIEYGIAQLGALQVWQRSRTDRKAAVAAYRSALALGGSRPLPELFEASGATFDFSAATIAPLINDINEELERLGDA
ncbi:M3 family oligoendopeptidase [Tautonia rosea]|uniref:M3 family oligoendopeptidase n=1 Tax=Tautonia rosea TaxID=2728037 RepID=UPI0014731399|nr:M3 family oligoendopeptidase [Tautonia rosea]